MPLPIVVGEEGPEELTWQEWIAKRFSSEERAEILRLIERSQPEEDES